MPIYSPCHRARVRRAACSKLNLCRSHRGVPHMRPCHSMQGLLADALEGQRNALAQVNEWKATAEASASSAAGTHAATTSRAHRSPLADPERTHQATPRPIKSERGNSPMGCTGDNGGAALSGTQTEETRELLESLSAAQRCAHDCTRWNSPPAVCLVTMWQLFLIQRKRLAPTIHPSHLQSCRSTAPSTPGRARPLLPTIGTRCNRYEHCAGRARGG